MTRGVARICGIGATAVVVFLAGCGKAAPRVNPDQPDPEAGAAAITQHDANHDGLLDAAELEKVPGLKAALTRLDTDGDGKVSAPEIAARIQAWADSKVGRIGLTCIVTLRRRPLEGATVNLVPESFLGPGLKTASGRTDVGGVAMPTTPNEGDQAEGVCPGFYRVEIVGTGEPIPATYNTQSVLGLEVAIDAESLLSGPVRFDLP